GVLWCGKGRVYLGVVGAYHSLQCGCGVARDACNCGGGAYHSLQGVVWEGGLLRSRSTYFHKGSVLAEVPGGSGQSPSEHAWHVFRTLPQKASYSSRDGGLDGMFLTTQFVDGCWDLFI
ncbi:hypothetical protein CYMTET_20184, partial [Cymbomonas tetramitiformis]